MGRLKALSLIALAALAAGALQRPPEVRYPLKDEGVETLNARASAQKQTSGQFEVHQMATTCVGLRAMLDSIGFRIRFPSSILLMSIAPN